MKTHDTPDHILRHPLTNKGTGFTNKERDFLKLHGLLPCKVTEPSEQIERNYRNFRKKKTALGRYDFLNSLLNRNEILFYLLADQHIEEVMRYIYTPTVGEAALEYSMIYKQRRGLYLSYPLRDKMEEMIGSIEGEVDVIVVTDGERILGLGDQGIGGMVIPVGKLALYTLFGGIHPSKTLPIILDVGTDNDELLNHEMYIGYRSKRIRGKDYDQFVERFVKCIKKRFPNVLLQWEDFAKENAGTLLNRYQDEILSFNDDIQGTAAVALGAILSAVKKAKVKFEEQKMVVFGGGSAGMGICHCLKQALMRHGLSEKEAVSQIYVIDRFGLVHEGLEKIDATQKPFAKEKRKGEVSLVEVVKEIKPTVLIGVSAQEGAFTKEVIREMAKHTEKPIIFPLSNPTAKAEAFPEEIIQWTDAKGLVATGSPFAPVEYKGKTFPISQCNNVYIFPGIGLGAIAAKAKKITSAFFVEAAEELASHSPALKEDHGPILPSFLDLRKISRAIAIRVAKTAIKEGLSDLKESEVEKSVDKILWMPSYSNFVD